MSFDSIPVSLIEDITKNYDIIKTSFSSLSKLFSKLSKIEQAPIEVPSKEATPSNTELLSHKRVKRLHIPRGMKEYSKILKGIGFGRIISVHCYEEEEKVTGYKIHLRYYKSNYTIGPFKDYDFTCKLNKTIQEELKMLGCTKANYRDKVNAKIEEIKYQSSELKEQIIASIKGYDARVILAPSVPEWLFGDPGRIGQMLVKIIKTILNEKSKAKILINLDSKKLAYALNLNITLNISKLENDEIEALSECKKCGTFVSSDELKDGLCQECQQIKG